MYPTPSQRWHTIIVTYPRNGFADARAIEGDNPVLSVAEYRKLFNDNITSDDLIRERINFLVRYTRKAIRGQMNLCRK